MDLIFQRYEEFLVRKGRAESTIVNYRTAVRHFTDWLNAQGLRAADVGEDEFEDYLHQLSFAVGTKRIHLVQIGAAYRRALRKGWGVKCDPTTDIELESEPQREPSILSTEQLRVIRDRSFKTRDWVLFHLFAYAGVRRIEVCRLLWEDVHLDKQWMLIKGKGQRGVKVKLRQVPIHPALQEAFEQHAPRSWARNDRAVLPNARGAPLTPSALCYHQKRLAPEANGFHDFRRTVATSLRRNGVDDSVRDRIMGWAPAGVFERYYDHVCAPELHEAILKLYADDPL